MKKSFLIVLLMCMALTVRAQFTFRSIKEPEQGMNCGKIAFMFTYNYRYVEDVNHRPYFFKDDKMLLEVGDQRSRFWSLSQFQTDSINAERKKQGENNFLGNGKVVWQLYRNCPEQGKYVYLDELGMDKFSYAEKVIFPHWNIEEDSVIILLGYTCHKATADYCGRKWRAWYTDDIPLDEGPWKLKGLPGMILKASDSEGQFVFEAIGMQQNVTKRNLVYIGNGYERIGRADFLKTCRRYYADPIGYITTKPNVKVTITEGNGNPLPNPKDQPYNLLER